MTYSALITACERAGKFTEALELYDEMLQAGIAADKVTFCSALAACEKSERWERAEQIVEDMHGRGMSGTTSIYFELLRHYARQADWNKGLDLFLTMQVRCWTIQTVRTCLRRPRRHLLVSSANF